MGEQTILKYPAVNSCQRNTIKWFTTNGCVEYRSDERLVFVAGTLIARFHRDDRYGRNSILLQLDQNRKIKKGKLAKSFGLSDDYLRRMRHRVSESGEIPSKSPGGKHYKLCDEDRKRVFDLFSKGISTAEIHRSISKKGSVTYQCIWLMRRDWDRKQQQPSNEPTSGCPEQLELEIALKEKTSQASDEVELSPITTKEVDSIDSIRSGKRVQYAGGLLLLSLVSALGLHSAAVIGWKASKRWIERLRIAIDSIVLAMGLGQKCVEGVRRLQTPTAPILLRTTSMPSESWIRRIIKQYVKEEGSAKIHLGMLALYLDDKISQEQPAIFYIDNHMRPYTGKQKVRKGWRMQDKRAKPGATDYYVHDEDGRPLARFDVPSHDSLSKWLLPITEMLREGLGKEQRILVAFDRAGCFPEQMAELREHGFEFVTYERKPYRKLPSKTFTKTIEFKDGEEVGIHEKRLTNLKKGRGRVRRIALRMPDKSQVNLLAVSEESAQRLVEIITGRWVQENGFKHGNQRWGINQLDGRKVHHYTPETVIPNPGRRRLDYSLRILCSREGTIRNKLARLPEGHQNIEVLKEELIANLEEQEELRKARPNFPAHAELQDTELADKLVYHDTHVKTFIDTIRIACANVESDLAAEIAPYLRKGKEAKKALANLFSSPGDIKVNGQSITITVLPTGRRDELEAFKELFAVINEWKLTLPGDPRHRHLRFRSRF